MKKTMGIGSLTVMMVFVCLCLLVFATLALLRAHRDEVFTDKVVQNVTDYYQADQEAQTKWLEITQYLRTHQGKTLDLVVEDLEQWADVAPIDNTSALLTFEEPCGAQMVLSVILRIDTTYGTVTKQRWALKHQGIQDFEYEEIEFSDLIIGG